MKFTDFIETLKQKKILNKNCDVSFKFDSVIFSEADAAESLINSDISRIQDKIIIVDSDFLLAANIDGANKYKMLSEFVKIHDLKHLTMTNSGTLPNAVLNSKLLKAGTLNLSFSCKVVAPYIQANFVVLPHNSENSNIENLLHGCIKLPENLQVFELNLEGYDFVTQSPENLAFSIVTELNKLGQNVNQQIFNVLLWKIEDLKKIPLHHQNRIFGLLNNFDCSCFEGSLSDFDFHKLKEFFQHVKIDNFHPTISELSLMLDDSENVKTELKNIETVDRIFLGGCTAGDIKSIEEIAKIVAGKNLTKKIEVILTPSDFKTYQKSADLGYLTQISKAGINIAMPSCASCKGKHTGVLADCEIALSTFPLGEKGRHGSATSTVNRVSVRTILDFIFDEI